MKTSKRVFITGIGGFIGGYLAKRLVVDGYEVHGLYQNIEDQTVSPIKGWHGDLLNFDRMVEILVEVNPSFIVHLAAKTEVEKSFYDPTGFSQANYVGTVNLIEASRKVLGGANGGALELFVFSSTMETYGIVDKKLWTAFDEDTPQRPNAPYAVAKLACEHYLNYAQETYGLPYCILRQSNTYGRHDNDFFVVEQFITQMLKEITLPGNSFSKEVNFGYREPYRNFLYIDDLIDLYAKVLRNVDLVRNEVFCTGPDNVIQIEDLADLIGAKLGWSGTINWGRKLPRPGEIYFLNSTPEKAWRVLRWKPLIDLSNGLNRTITMWRGKIGVNKLREKIGADPT